jgi:hypothetical protein
MTLSGSTITLIAVTAILVIVVVAIFLVILRRLRARRDQILSELGAKPALVQDRAFNRLAMARREAELLGRTGTDTSRAQELIAQSQGAFDTRQYPRSYELAQSAHEALVHARGRAGSPGPVAGTPRPPLSGSSVSSDTPAAPPAAPLPRNRAESQFQMRLLDTELTAARAAHPAQGTTLEATQIQGQAQAAFDGGEFTEAFRLALRARRTLGGKVEALAASPRLAGSVGPGLTGPPTSLDPTASAERVAGADRCPNCGYPTLPEDTFCRGCGVPRAATVCPACQSPRAPSDTFCGRCGAQFGP